MKKVLNVALCLAIITSAVVFAATKIDFTLGGLTGQLKTKASATVSETNGWVVFDNMGEKDSVTISAISGNVTGILMDGGKLLKQKGKITGNIDNIIIASQAPDITNPDNIVTTLAGNEKLSIKLKGVNVGTVLAKTIKMVLVNDINGAIGGTAAKGVKIMTQDGNIQGDATERVLVGAYDYAVAGIGETNIAVTTMIKAIKAKKGMIGYVDATTATAAKAGKTKWIAKVASAGDVLVTAGQFDVLKSAKKHVTLTE